MAAGMSGEIAARNTLPQIEATNLACVPENLHKSFQNRKVEGRVEDSLCVGLFVIRGSIPLHALRLPCAKRCIGCVSHAQESSNDSRNSVEGLIRFVPESV